MKFLPFVILLGSLLFPASADHLLLIRIVTQPDAAESFSIYNPTDSPIDLTNYYICDDEDYFTMQTEGDLSPSHIASGFTAQFPDININSEDTLTIVLNNSYGDFYGSYFIPDLLLYGTETNSMLETKIGSFGGASDKMNDNAEMIILFYWDGNPTSPIQDVDYFIWGSSQNAFDKSDLSGYQNDTPIENQLFFELEAETYYAYSRIGTNEIDEIQTGGNGITGHDETSEKFRLSWEIIELFNIGCIDEAASNYDPEAEINDWSCEYILTISEIINGSYLDREVTTKGIIIDYFDITPFGGPHAITISDESSNESVELTIWSDSWNEELDLLVQPPFFTKEIMITGIVGEYEGKIQIEITETIETLNENYEWDIPTLTIPDILEGLYDGQVITTQGTISDYFDITVYNGPHAITIEDESAFVHELAAVTGNVIIGEKVYIGPGAAIRGDWGEIKISDGCNVQENCTIHVFPGKSVLLKSGAHIGHGAVIHGGNIGRNTLIGMNSVVMDDAEVGDECIVGALCFIKGEMKIPNRKLVVGSPAIIKGDISDEMIAWKSGGTKLYQQLPEDCYKTLQECEPLREIPADRPPQITNFKPWKETKK